MGFGTHILLPVYYSKETLDSKWKVEEEIIELKRKIAFCRERIMSLIFSNNLRDFVVAEDLEGGRSVADIIHDTVSELLGELGDWEVKLSEYETILQHWDKAHETVTREKDGQEQKVTVGLVPSSRYDSEWWDKMYIGGDFIHEKTSDGKITFYDNF